MLLGRVLRRMGAIAAARDDVETARGLLEESVAVLRGAGDETEEAVSLLHLGSLLADESRTAEALPLLVRARDALRAAGDPLQEAPRARRADLGVVEGRRPGGGAGCRRTGARTLP